MDALPYVDTLFKEYLLFRGFTTTLEAFNKDLANDPGCGFQAERIAELIFRKLIPRLDCQQLVDFLEFLNIGLYSRLDSRYEPLVSAVEADLLRLFLVTAHNAKRPDKIAEFFKLYGPQLLSNSRSRSGIGPEDICNWQDWFVLPYLQFPEREQRFQVYFSPEWASLLETSFRNFLAGVMRCLPLPAVLRFNTDRRLRLALQQQVQVLQAELEQSKKQLAAVEAELQVTQQAQHQQREAFIAQNIPLPQQGQQEEDSKQHTQHAPPITARLSTLEAVDQAQSPALLPASAHKRDLSLGGWQQQQTAVPGISSLPQHMHSSTAVQAEHAREMRSSRKEGSGLFELLPSPQQSLTASGAAVIAGVAGQQQQYLGADILAGSVQKQHSRTASVGGGISFPVAQYEQQPDDNEGAAAVAAQCGNPDDSHNQQQPQQDVLGDTDDLGAVSRPAIMTSDSTDMSTASSLRVSSSVASGAAAAAAAAAVPLSSSPVMSWASGMALASSAAGLRPQHTSGTITSSSSSPGGWRDATTAADDVQPWAAAKPVVLLPGPLRCSVTVSKQQDPSGSSSAGITCVAFSPSGGNIATAYSDGAVSIWSPQGIPEAYPHRCASFACGKPVTSIAWDLRADKLMLVGCSNGGGVRAWHADIKRVVGEVGAEAGYQHIIAVAACPAEPGFVVAANSKSLPDHGASVSAVSGVEASAGAAPEAVAGHRGGGGSSSPLHGRLVLYNSRSFKRSAVLAVPGDVGLVSLAYNSSGGQLAVGSAVGTALLYEPSSRNSPLKVWQVARACGVSNSGSTSSLLPVQVSWRQNSAASTLTTASSSSSIGNQSGAAGGTGSLLTLCNGVLCEWSVNSNSKAPAAAVDIIAAAAAALDMQQQDDKAAAVATPMLNRTVSDWSWCFAVSGSGNSCAVLGATESAGAVLLYELGCGAEASWTLQAPQVLLAGEMLAGGGDLSWHPSCSLLVVGASKHSSRLMVLGLDS